MEDTRALTIRQPWAALIMMGRKRIETRSKRTTRTGRVFIHAATTMGRLEREVAIREGLDPDTLPRGVIVGTADIDSAIPAEDFRKLSDAERSRGDFTPGRWGWILKNVNAIETPVPAEGALSFWKVPADVVDAVEKQLLTKVFVYGTLKIGYCNHRLLETSRFIGRDSVRGSMHDYGSFPAVSLRDDGRPAGAFDWPLVHGEVYEVNPETLRRLDSLEGCPTLYQRTRVRMTTGREAWVYTMQPERLKRLPPVHSGRWERHYGDR